MRRRGRGSELNEGAVAAALNVRSEPNDLRFELTPRAMPFDEGDRGVMTALVVRVVLTVWVPLVVLAVGNTLGVGAALAAALALVPVGSVIGWLVYRLRPREVRLRGVELRIGRWHRSLLDVTAARYEPRLAKTTTEKLPMGCLVVDLRNEKTWVFPLAHPPLEIGWVAEVITRAAEKARGRDGDVPDALMDLLETP